jgi:hypothetical protein
VLSHRRILPGPEHLPDRVKFRVGQIVYAAFFQDETIMGFGFPREERDALLASEPDKFVMPNPSDMRYRWVLGLRRPDRHDALEYATTRTLELAELSAYGIGLFQRFDHVLEALDAELKAARGDEPGQLS